MSEQMIEVPLTVGDRVTLLEAVEIEDDAKGYKASPFFEDYVEQYVPETGLLEFEDSDIGLAEFTNLVDDAEGISVLRQ